MTETYDVVIAGAGHNGLMTAAYLAKAGVNVCVVEHQAYVGGGVITRELTLPGFKHDLCSTWHAFIFPNPVIKDDELDLQAKFGLKYIVPSAYTGVVFDDETGLVFYRDLDKTCESIAKISEHDAQAYRKFHDVAIRTLDVLAAGMYSPPPPFSAQFALLEQSDEGRELLRAMMISALDVVDEVFESDKLKIALSRYASEAMINPAVKGTGMVLFLFVPLIHKYGGGIPVGGSGELSESLVRCIKHHGGTIRLSSTVKSFKIAGGECSGLVLESGEEILARKAVVTNFNIKQLPDMIGEDNLPQNFSRRVENLAFSNFVPLNQHIALNEEPKYKLGGDMNEVFWVEYSHSTMEGYLKAFYDLDFGYPRADLSINIVATKFDKTRAPEGKHTLYLYAFEPFELKDGGAAKWDEIGQEVADSILEQTRKMTTNMGDENILGRNIFTPLDYARHNPSYINGDFAHIGQFLWQQGASRPMLGWGDYRLPVKKLYLCGPSAHPGVGVSGGGRGTVQVIMEDLGIDFEKVIS